MAQSGYTQARVRADQLWAEMKRSAPSVFAPPLALEQARRALPLATLFVAYSVGSQQVYLVLLRAGSDREPALSISILPASPGGLSMLLGRGRPISDPRSERTAAIAAGRTLFAALFPPAARKQVLAAKRLLISPDGLPWEVPFAALVTNSAGPPQYLGAAKALTYTPSLTLFAQARGDRRPQGPGRRPVALVVGDPIFDRQPSRLAAAGSDEPVVRGERALLLGEGRSPARLPATRIEAERIAPLYESRPLTGEAATEAAVRQQIESADVIHLATHGYLDPTRDVFRSAADGAEGGAGGGGHGK